jgi:tRNA uridine 5-carbamoylmethylation protein Kti12
MKNKSMWILVEVRSGIPLSAKTFFEEKLAKVEETKLRKTLNLENDETAIFEVEVSDEKNNVYPIS